MTFAIDQLASSRECLADRTRLPAHAASTPARYAPEHRFVRRRLFALLLLQQLSFRTRQDDDGTGRAGEHLLCHAPEHPRAEAAQPVRRKDDETAVVLASRRDQGARWVAVEQPRLSREPVLPKALGCLGQVGLGVLQLGFLQPAKQIRIV
jgi:hypothetical protein